MRLARTWLCAAVPLLAASVAVFAPPCPALSAPSAHAASWRAIRPATEERAARAPRPQFGTSSEATARALLMGAKDALSRGNTTWLRGRLARRVYLNLFTGVNGYYSNEQAWMILEEFFVLHRAVSFTFSSRNFSIRSPYGFGPLTYERLGRRGNAEMFLSLAATGRDWTFNQVTITRR